MGKGQIADLPTAIYELWKNGYDAYATEVSADIYMSGCDGLKHPIVVLSDNGKGMSHDDILNKWLVLGSDSKSRLEEDIQGEDTLWLDPRIKAGEKGIGRLSVAYLGSQMLMLTKKLHEPLQALFFDWRILDNYNLFIDDVEIPVSNIFSIEDFDSKFVNLVSKVETNLKETPSHKPVIWEQSQMYIKQSLESDIENIKLGLINFTEIQTKQTEKIQLPEFFYKDILSKLLDLEDSHGTSFVIFNPDMQLINITTHVDEEDNIEDVDFFRNSMAGFVNTFKEKKNRNPVENKLLIHKPDVTTINYLDSYGRFFEPEDFNLADVIIDGVLDGEGSFSGDIIMYDKKVGYHYTNPRRRNRTSHYGACKVKLGYSMGELKDSKLDEANWNNIKELVNRYGGFYIYRDGFRVLPYGRAGQDFTGIEEARSKRASSMFFSYRRMFGYIDISRVANPLLQDKSSREGLINNGAYRAFSNDIFALLKSLADEYFSDRPKQDTFLEMQRAFNKESEIIKQDKERQQEEKKEFSKALKEFDDKFNSIKDDYSVSIEHLQILLKEADRNDRELEQLLNHLTQLKLEYDSLLPKYPSYFSLTEDQEKRYEKCKNAWNVYGESIHKDIDELSIQARKRLETKALRDHFKNENSTYRAVIEQLIEKNKNVFNSKIHQLSEELNTKSNNYISEFINQIDKSASFISSTDDIEIARTKVREAYESIIEQYNNTITPLIEHIKKISWEIDEELLRETYRQQYEQIKQQWELAKETAQLGTAVEIIDHEFNSLYTRINDTLSNLNQNKTIGSIPEYKHLEKYFKALEYKYSLLSPLYKISGSFSKNVSGETLVSFLNSFFENKLRNEQIDLRSTQEFDQHVIFTKEPVIYSVLINIVNNAIYWLRNSEKKIIEFDYYENSSEIIIRNSGEPIMNSKLERIFELFYSMRPSGRGLGLYLSRDSLAENYYSIRATNDTAYNTLHGACFVIKPIESKIS